VPWPLDPQTKENLWLAPDEVFCHWISSREHFSNLDFLQEELPSRYFNMDDKLLIGAANTSRPEFRYNELCQRSVTDVKQALTDIHGLNHLKTARRSRYKDSDTVQVQGGGLGLTVGTTKTYRRRDGTTWKEALVERWRDRKLRNPVILESDVGLEVSLCTKNARWIMLLDVLRSDTMRNYLRGIGFSWNESVERRYFDSLQSPGRFRKLWKWQKYRENVGDAISICFDALAETGVDLQTGELHALWVFESKLPTNGAETSLEEDVSTGSSSESDDAHEGNDWEPAEEHIVSLFRSEHTWTRFLKDTRDLLTMAIVEDNCLMFNRGKCRPCSAWTVREDGKEIKLVGGFPSSGPGSKSMSVC
jgi:hypothetical protein